MFCVLCFFFFEREREMVGRSNMELGKAERGERGERVKGRVSHAAHKKERIKKKRKRRSWSM